MNIFESPIANPAAKSAEPVNLSSTNITTEDKIRRSGIKTADDIFEMYLEKDDKIKMDEFGGVYTAEEIEHDKKRVENMKKSKSYVKPTKEGIVLENMFCDLAEKHEWLCAGAKIVLLSEFDDMIIDGAHCDAVLEIPASDGSVIRIGLDLTSAVNYDVLNKKRLKCLEAVENGKLFSVKYFKSKIDQTAGRIDNLPVFFVGVDKDTIKRLCESVAIQENTGRDILKKMDVQLMIINELVAQAETYYGHAIDTYGESGFMSQLMDYYQRLFDKIQDNKKSLSSNSFEQKALGDKVYEYITKFV